MDLGACMYEANDPDVVDFLGVLMKTMLMLVKVDSDILPII